MRYESLVCVMLLYVLSKRSHQANWIQKTIESSVLFVNPFNVVCNNTFEWLITRTHKLKE